MGKLSSPRARVRVHMRETLENHRKKVEKMGKIIRPQKWGSR